MAKVKATSKKKVVGKKKAGKVAGNKVTKKTKGRAMKSKKSPAVGRTGDARSKIIAKKRNKMTDARDRLAKIAKTTDAREKLKKLKNLKEGRLDISKTKKGGLTITRTTQGGIVLMTKKHAAKTGGDQVKKVGKKGNLTKRITPAGSISLTTKAKTSALKTKATTKASNGTKKAQASQRTPPAKKKPQRPMSAAERRDGNGIFNCHSSELKSIFSFFRGAHQHASQSCDPSTNG